MRLSPSNICFSTFHLFFSRCRYPLNGTPCPRQQSPRKRNAIKAVLESRVGGVPSKKEKKQTEHTFRMCACQLNTTLLVFLFFLRLGTLCFVLRPSVLLSFQRAECRQTGCRIDRLSGREDTLQVTQQPEWEGGREGVPGYPYLPGCQAGANDPAIARGAGATVSAVVQSKPTSARCFSRRGPVAPTEFLHYAALGGPSVSPRPPDPQSPSPTGSNMVAHSSNWSCSPGASANQKEPRDVTSCWELKSFLGVFFPL